jgi:molybdate transport system substrate-binding protein
MGVMRMRLLAAVRIAFALGAILALPAQPATQLRVIISGGFAPAYNEVLPEFERTTGIKVTTGSGASQGKGPDTIGAMLRRGEAADMVIMSRLGLAELAAEGRVVAGSELDLAQGLIGVSMRAGSPKPDLSTVDAFKQTLLRAKVIAVPGSTAASFGNVTQKLGITNQIEIKSPGRGAESVAMVARGEAVHSIQPVSEILNIRGVELAGTLPAEIHYKPVFTAAILTASKQQEACKKLISFLSSGVATAAIRKNGMEPAKRP